MALRCLPSRFNSIVTRLIHTTSFKLGGQDGREKRMGHLELPDTVEGEKLSSITDTKAYELVDENLFTRVINNVPFRKIPMVVITCTRNNTKITLVGGDGNLIAAKSAGSEGFKNCRKGTTVAAQAVANRVLSIARDNEITMARMIFNGLGPGRNPAFKVFEMAKFNIVSFTDRTQATEPWDLRPRAAKSV